MDATILIYLKSLLLAWLWLELSPLLMRLEAPFPALRRIREQGTMDCLALYLLLLGMVQTPVVQHWLHIIFPPFLLLDIVLADKEFKQHIFFWVEILILMLLVSSGLTIGFVSHPDGGMYFLEGYSTFLSFFWLLFLVSLLNLCNFLDGLLLGICAVITHTFLFAIFTQTTLNAGALDFALTLCPLALLYWLYTMLGERKGLAAPILSSTLAIVIGILSIIATSKKLALLSLGMTMGLFAVPIAFFAFLIFYTHFQYKFGAGQLDNKPQVLWRFSTESVNVFAVLASLCLNFILVCALITENWFWFFGLCLLAGVLFLRLAKRVFIKKVIRYKDIFFASQDHISLFGIRIFRGKKARAVEIVDRVLTQPFIEMQHIVTPDALCLYRATQDRDFQLILSKAMLAIPDGAGVLWTSIFLKERPILERIPGVEFVNELLNLSIARAIPVFVLGARDEVLAEAVHQLQQTHEGLNICDSHHGYFSEADEPALIERINLSGAGILLVAMGVPRQEEFLDRHRQQLRVKIAMGIGGSLDVLSGRIRRCPKVIQDFGFEWLYRTIREPWRISRIYALPMYIVTVLKEKLILGDAKQSESQ